MLRKIVLVVVAVWFVGVLWTLAVSVVFGSDDADGSRDLSMEELGARLASTVQSDYREAQRDRNLDGRITVVRVDCKNEDYPRFTCLAQVAATGQARRLRPNRPPVITGRHGGGGGWVVNENWVPSP